MWPQNYAPIAGSLAWSALAAATPILVLLILLGLLRRPAWQAALAGLGAAIAVAAFEYGMPAGRLFAAVTYGGAFGLFPIGWVVFGGILLYRVSAEGGKFELLKASIGRLTGDRMLQALLIAFAFGAFIEGAAGFGTPVAVAAAMLAGLGFEPFYAAAVCLLANTAPVAFGSIGIPVITLAGVTNLPVERVSAAVGRICAPVSLFIPAYLVLVMFGRKGLRSVWKAAALCGAVFAVTQLVVSNLLGPQLTDILASLASMAALVVYIRSTSHPSGPSHGQTSRRALVSAWMPYILLVIFVLVWGIKPVQQLLNAPAIPVHWPALDNTIQRLPPAVPKPVPYAAVFNFNWLSASGTACFLAALSAALVTGMKARQFAGAVARNARQLAMAELTLAAVLALAFLMNYSGATGTLGLAFAATGPCFPFFSALLGWVGVFLTGSDTSANALFGPLQTVAAGHLGMNPALMAAANSAGGVMGKMISLTSIAVAVAATSMRQEEEARLFRFTLKHSALLASVIGLVVLFYAYVAPGWAP